MGKPKENKKDKIKELEREEFQLFSTYNRHKSEKWKIDHLQKLITVISTLDHLKACN